MGGFLRQADNDGRKGRRRFGAGGKATRAAG